METPSESEAESVPERFDVVASDELSVSTIDPAVGVAMTGASLTTWVASSINSDASDSRLFLRPVSKSLFFLPIQFLAP